MTTRSTPFRALRIGLAVTVATQAGVAFGADVMAGNRPDRPEATPFTFACGGAEPCRPQAGPGPADRQVRPFEGSLGRPCAYRWRDTPSGTRQVRVCF